MLRSVRLHLPLFVSLYILKCFLFLKSSKRRLAVLISAFFPWVSPDRLRSSSCRRGWSVSSLTGFTQGTKILQVFQFSVAVILLNWLDCVWWSVVVCVSSGTDSTSPQCLWQRTAAAGWLWQVKPHSLIPLTDMRWCKVFVWLNRHIFMAQLQFFFFSVPECSSIQREDARAPPGVSLLLLHPPPTQRRHSRQEGRSAALWVCVDEVSFRFIIEQLSVEQRHH